MKNNYFKTPRHIGPLAIVGSTCIKEEQNKVEAEYHVLYQAYEEAKRRIQDLQDANEVATQKVKRSHQKIADLQQILCESACKLVNPPKAEDFYAQCNRDNWFQGYEVDHNGTIYLKHGRKFYPCESIVVPCGALRMYRLDGITVNLTQNYGYNALPKQYAQPYLPTGYEAYKSKILFGTARGDEFWLDDPRSAQDIIIDIWASRDKEEDGDLQVWEQQYGGDARTFSRAENVFTLITPFTKFLNGCSKLQIDKIRQQCYAEYLSVYFNDAAT